MTSSSDALGHVLDALEARIVQATQVLADTAAEAVEAAVGAEYSGDRETKAETGAPSLLSGHFPVPAAAPHSSPKAGRRAGHFSTVDNVDGQGSLFFKGEECTPVHDSSPAPIPANDAALSHSAAALSTTPTPVASQFAAVVPVRRAGPDAWAAARADLDALVGKRKKKSRGKHAKAERKSADSAFASGDLERAEPPEVDASIMNKRHHKKKNKKSDKGIVPLDEVEGPEAANANLDSLRGEVQEMERQVELLRVKRAQTSAMLQDVRDARRDGARFFGADGASVGGPATANGRLGAAAALGAREDDLGRSSDEENDGGAAIVRQMLAIDAMLPLLQLQRQQQQQQQQQQQAHQSKTEAVCVSDSTAPAGSKGHVGSEDEKSEDHYSDDPFEDSTVEDGPSLSARVDLVEVVGTDGVEEAAPPADGDIDTTIESTQQLPPSATRTSVETHTHHHVDPTGEFLSEEP
jgi:hypothetical protein